MNETNPMEEDWDLLLTMMPRRWRQLAGETAALKGLRQDKDEANYLRTLLLHLGCGYSLRETAVRAREAKLADLSDVALLKRLRKSKDWLQALCVELLHEQAQATRPVRAEALRLIDATLVREPGPTGSSWRLHYSLRWPQLTCDDFRLTREEGEGSGESLVHFDLRRGDHVVADRAYSHYGSLRHATDSGAWLTLRLNPQGVRLLDGKGQRFALERNLRRLKKSGEVQCWPVQISSSTGQSPVTGRLCVLRKSRLASAKSQAKARRAAIRNGRKIETETLLYAQYVLVFSTAPAHFSAVEVLEIYRLRWQIELVFKRFKQLAQLGHLPKEDEESSKAWLYGKLFVALLAERLIQQAESFSPWGYDVAPPPPAEPVA
jgi:hypothetical protein